MFVDEQGVGKHEEVDGLDDQCTHFLMRLNGAAIGAARSRRIGNYVKIQRVCVLPSARGGGLGANLIEAVCRHAREEFSLSEARLDAQVDAIEFYRRLGFVEEGEVFMDAGIAHKRMRAAL